MGALSFGRNCRSTFTLKRILRSKHAKISFSIQRIQYRDGDVCYWPSVAGQSG